jgi:histone acetyltransferase (RNA polymerase elongator complex component)
MSESPLIIPIFVVHHGCPHRCIFCDQRFITGRSPADGEVDGALVAGIIHEWLARPRRKNGRTEVAFFGGSFTAMAQERQEELLLAVQPFLRDGRVDAIRLSTRPDAVDPARAEMLRRHGVKVVELGVQSMEDTVLAASGRGYGVAQVEPAVRCLRQAGLTVGIQLMVGLPGETTGRLLLSTSRVTALVPDFVRIYPTLVLRDSGLHGLLLQERYRPLSMHQAVARVTRLKRLFDASRIQVVRMGLQPTPTLEANIMAGPYHPAFGELVMSRGMFQETRRQLACRTSTGPVTVAIAPRDESIFRGPGNGNLKRLAALGLLHQVTLVRRPEQPRQTVEVEEAVRGKGQAAR